MLLSEVAWASNYLWLLSAVQVCETLRMRGEVPVRRDMLLYAVQLSEDECSRRGGYNPGASRHKASNS